MADVANSNTNIASVNILPFTAVLLFVLTTFRPNETP